MVNFGKALNLAILCALHIAVCNSLPHDTDFPPNVEPDKTPTPSASSDPPTPSGNPDDSTTTNKTSIEIFINIFTNDSNKTSVGAFHLALKKNIDLLPMSNIMLENFQAVNGREDLFISDGNSGLNPISGHFTPKADGIFLLATHVHVSKGDDVISYPKVKVEICMDKDCTLIGLKSTAAVISTEHTISIVGALWLREAQGVKVRVTSESTSQLTVLKESSFMAFPLSRPAEDLIV